jgi:uncharacterized iron-regulated membrane protein
MWPRLHRWAAIALVAPLVVWSITGLLFHLKPGWKRAYDMVSIERPLEPTETKVASFETLSFKRLELFGSAIGPLYRLDGSRLVDARTLAPKSPLSIDDAKTLAQDAVAHSSQSAGYGALVDVKADDSTVHVKFANATVDLDRASGSVYQHGADTARIDWLYRIHYLKWTNVPRIDRVVSVLGLALIWLAMVAGLVLFVRRYRRR